MKILLSEGSGLTSRQVSGRLWTAGHHVGVVSCDPLGLNRFTRTCRAWHRVPAFGVDPLAWLDATIDTYQTHSYEVLLPTQEQVTVLAAFPKRLQAEGVRTAVPSFASLSSVQDKLAGYATLTRLGLPQPPTAMAGGPADLTTWDEYPVYLKTPIGTATSGVHLLRNGASMEAFVASGATSGPPPPCASRPHRPSPSSMRRDRRRIKLKRSRCSTTSASSPLAHSSTCPSSGKPSTPTEPEPRTPTPGHTVCADLTFDDDHQLIDFVSDDRYRASADGKAFTRQRWSTPVSGYRDIRGCHIAFGRGRWHPTDQPPFDYIEFFLDDITYLRRAEATVASELSISESSRYSQTA